MFPIKAKNVQLLQQKGGILEKNQRFLFFFFLFPGMIFWIPEVDSESKNP